MNLIVLVAFVVRLDSTFSQHVLSCPDNDCWCCPFKAGKCYNDEGMTPCCCELQDAFPCYEGTEAYQCCQTGTTCCYNGCCPDGTTCCGEDTCCYDVPYLFHASCLVSSYWSKSAKADRPQTNFTSTACGKPNCFCCCEDLVCPIQQSGSTESCIERSQDIDMYCDEMSACPRDEGKNLVKKQHPVAPQHINENFGPKIGFQRLGTMDMKGISEIRQQFYDHQVGVKNTNFQFAVFKFGPSDSDWHPSINDPGIDWSSSLVVQDIDQNTWQASSYASCVDGCHTESVIINDPSNTGLYHMFSHECTQEYDPPHTLNIYSYNSPCITGAGCQTLIQSTLTSFFGDETYAPCNQREWVINIAWTLQYHDQNAQDCHISWGSWAGDISDEHPHVTISFGRQSVERLVTTEQLAAIPVGRHSLYYLLTAAMFFIGCILILLFRFKILNKAS